MFNRNKDKKPRSWPRRIARWLVILLIVSAVAGYASIEITSRSSFCNRCHIMNPYYDSWTTDAHSDSECVDCHIPPGATNYISAKMNGLGQVVDDWLNRTSTKPSASVSDFACTREGCHVIADIDTSDHTERGFFFDHSKHAQHKHLGIRIGCTTCHSHVKGDKNHFEVNRNACVTCHLMPTTGNHSVAVAHAAGSTELVLVSRSVQEDAVTHPAAEEAAPSDCASCHEPPAEPFEYQGLTVDHAEYLSHGAACESCHRDATATVPAVGDAACLSCHTFGAEKITDYEDMHRIHTEGAHKVECFSCHGLIDHGPSAEILALGQFDCRSCHTDQHQVQRQAYLSDHQEPEAGEQTLISPMFLAHVDCTACHIEPDEVSTKPGSGAVVARAVPEACDVCHQAGFGDQMIPLWQNATRDMYDAIIPLLPTADDPWAQGDAEAEQFVREAIDLLDLVRIDGSWGVHNPRFTQGLIEQARVKVLEARRIVENAPESSP